jgi:hypothetical protein
MNAPLTPPAIPAYHYTPLFRLGVAARVGKPRHALRMVAIALAATALVMQIPYAQAQQHKTPGAGPTDKQKAHDAEVRAYEKQTDKAYRETLKQIPDAKPNADPWGNLRAAPPK